MSCNNYFLDKPYVRYIQIMGYVEPTGTKIKFACKRGPSVK